MSAGLARCAVPTSIHCDHLIQAVDGAASDLKVPILFVYSELSCDRSGYRGPLCRTRKFLTFWRVLRVNTALNFGSLVLGLYTKSF